MINKFQFRQTRTLLQTITWRCTNKDCNSWVKTDSKKTKLLSAKHEHKHQTACDSPTLSYSTPRTRATTTTANLQTTPASPDISTATSSLTPNPSATPTVNPDLLEENRILKNEIAELKAELKVVLDHSIESDQRLLNFTSDIFTKPSTPPHSPSQSTLINQSTQTEPAPSKHACTTCHIYKDETANMIETIKILEAENLLLKQNNNTIFSPSPNIKLKNSFDALTDLEDIDTSGSFTVVNARNKNDKNRNKKLIRQSSITYKKTIKNKNNIKITKTKLPFRNVTVVGDSHSRHLSAYLRDRTTADTNITGICKPGAGLLQIAPSTTPPENHCYVLVAGTNDLAAGRQDVVFQHMEEVIKKCRQTSSVLVSPLPFRYDLPSTSPVHGHVALANHYISELCERYEGVQLIDLSNISRDNFTTHGLHLNASGKSLFAAQLVRELCRLPRRFSRTAAKPTPPSTHVPTSPSVYETYAAATINMTTSQLTPNIKQRQTDYRKQTNSNLSFLGAPLTSNGQN